MDVVSVVQPREVGLTNGVLKVHRSSSGKQKWVKMVERGGSEVPRERGKGIKKGRYGEVGLVRPERVREGVRGQRDEYEAPTTSIS